MSVFQQLSKDFKMLFIVTAVGGILIMLNGALNLIFGNAAIYSYFVSFPFLSGQQASGLVAVGAFISGLLIVGGILVAAASEKMFSFVNKNRIFVAIAAVVIAVLGFPTGGGFLIGFILVLLCGAWLIFINPQKRQSIRTSPHAKSRSPQLLINRADLNNEEKKILRLIRGRNGTILQSNVIQESGFSKVKITRILNRLEAKGAIERRRMGMSNLVILKQR